MKCKILIDPDREEEVLIYAKKESARIREIERFVTGDTAELIGYRDKQIRTLRPAEVHCFTLREGKLFATTDGGEWQIKSRLYEIEQLLDDSFIKINQSCIANVKKIDRFDASFAGALIVTFKNGYRDYVSRRCMKSVKERIGFHL